MFDQVVQEPLLKDEAKGLGDGVYDVGAGGITDEDDFAVFFDEVLNETDFGLIKWNPR